MTDIQPLTDEELAGPYGRVPKVWCCSDCRYRWEERLLATIDAKDAEIAKEVYDRNAAEDVIEELRAEIDALTLTDALQAKLEQAEQALVAAEGYRKALEKASAVVERWRSVKYDPESEGLALTIDEAFVECMRLCADELATALGGTQ